jgi:hypothetical protein
VEFDRPGSEERNGGHYVRLFRDGLHGRTGDGDSSLRRPRGPPPPPTNLRGDAMRGVNLALRSFFQPADRSRVCSGNIRKTHPKLTPSSTRTTIPAGEGSSSVVIDTFESARSCRAGPRMRGQIVPRRSDDSGNVPARDENGLDLPASSTSADCGFTTAQVGLTSRSGSRSLPAARQADRTTSSVVRPDRRRRPMRRRLAARARTRLAVLGFSRRTARARR